MTYDMQSIGHVRPAKIRQSLTFSSKVKLSDISLLFSICFVRRRNLDDSFHPSFAIQEETQDQDNYVFQVKRLEYFYPAGLQYSRT